MSSDDDIFFVDSSASDAEDAPTTTTTTTTTAANRLAHNGSQRQGEPVSASAPVPAANGSAYSHYSPAHRSTHASPTMEDVLFGLAPPRRGTPIASPPPADATSYTAFPFEHQHASSPHSLSASPTSLLSNLADLADGCVPSPEQQPGAAAAQPAANASAALLRSFPHAGGSPCVMPAVLLPPPPRPLKELRGMTSAEVREELERFFARKEGLSKRFKAVEREMRARTTGDDKSSSGGDGDGCFSSNTTAALSSSSSLPPSLSTTQEVLAWDRQRRLVNVSNWDAAVNGYSQWDVLLPSALLPPVTGHEADQGNKGPSPATRTLRPHQVEGIRFLWSVLAEGPVGRVPAVGCILAHTMGLGKTGQVVVFLHLFMAAFRRRLEATSPTSAATGRTSQHHHKHLSPSSRSLPPRVLIVIPKSTQSGWRREFETWSLCFPEAHRLRPLSIQDGMRPSERVDTFYRWRRDGGVLLVGYEALVRLVQLVEEDSVLTGHRSRRDDIFAPPSPAVQSDAGAQAESAQRQRRLHDQRERRVDEGATAYGGADDPFTELVVCDEAHRLKSVHLHVVRALRGLHPLRRMLLTGTPLQNHLLEYWAMMDFCLHKYFSRQRFREYFIHPIESSASTRASEKEVDLARKKTFTLINEVRHFVQRVDSSPLRAELPPLHEYVVVIPPSPLQRELYLRFIQIVQHDGSQKLQFLPAVSYSGKIAAHPQLLFQMRHQLAEQRAGHGGGSGSTGGRRGRGRGRAAGHAATQRSRVNDYWETERKNRRENGRGGRGAEEGRHVQQQQQLSVGQPTKRARLDDNDAANGQPHHHRHDPPEAQPSGDGDGVGSTIVISDSSSFSHSSDDDNSDSSEDVKTQEEEEFARVTQLSFSSMCRAPLTYEELCDPPSPTYTPRLEEGAKLYAAMKLIAAAVAQGEKVLFFSLSTQLLTFFESMIAKVNVDWCAPASAPPPPPPPHSQPWASGANPVLARPIRYCRLDGSHSTAQRAAMLDDFDKPDGPDLFLLSMKAGGVGITITAATRVILVDTSFNPADDQQAIGRAYRYGQTKPVFVYRLMCYPTLEYSIFVQKLAKEWLFKTVVEESSVKRDGLAGMHLKELFFLLTRAAKVLEKPPRATPEQARTTQDVLHDDPLLRTVESALLYAQRYEMFLESDATEPYGAEEEEFYKDYCRSRLFDTAEDGEGDLRRAEEKRLRRQQRLDDTAQLQSQSKTLTGMVDELIRTRAGTDPHLARLLTAMGLRVDPGSGRVHTTSTRAAPPPPAATAVAEAHERDGRPLGRHTGDRNGGGSAPPLEGGNDVFAPAPVLLVGDTAGTSAAVAQSRTAAGEGSSTATSRQNPVLLLDSDDEMSVATTTPPPPPRAPVVEKKLEASTGRRATDAAARARQIGASLARRPYERFRPGGSPSHAVEIDSDASQ